MITPYQTPEGKDEKATSFWSNLAGKLGLSAPLIRQASASEQKGQRLSDGIQTHSERSARQQITGSPEMRIDRVSAQTKVSDELVERYSHVMHRAVAELGQSERVKAADRLSRIESDMATFKDKVAGPQSSPEGLGGDRLMLDLSGEIGAKADAISGACVQLREKVGALSLPQAQAIENAFLVLSDAKTYLEKISLSPASGGDAMAMEIGLPDADLSSVGGDIPDMPPLPGAEAGRAPAMTREAMDQAYDDMRCIHTKLCLVESVLNSLVAELNVADMLPSEPVPGLAPRGMPPTEQMMGEQKDGDMPLSEASLCGRISRFAASGDPGDSEPGNLIYKDLNKCRDCVWFESDFTHETYRDKCKHCTHASLGGAVDHFWPRSQQMIVWSPQWSAPVASEKKAFTGTLSILQLGSPDKPVSAAVIEIARAIVAGVAHTAVDLGSELMSYFHDPVVARSMPAIVHEIAAEITAKTGIEVGLTGARAKAWGKKSAGVADGEVAIACDPSLVHMAKGEKRQIKELREKLRGERDPAKIKSLNEAINSLYDRIDSDKKRKEDRLQKREDSRKKEQESLDKEPAKFPTASLRGSLCLAEAYCDACDSVLSMCKCSKKTAGKMDHEDGGKHDQAAQPENGLIGTPPMSFKIVAVSQNRNAFGLHGVVLMAEDGTAYEAAHGQNGLPQKGDVISIQFTDDKQLDWGGAGFEIPKELPAPPQEVIDEVWGKRASSSGRSLR